MRDPTDCGGPKFCLRVLRADFQAHSRHTDTAGQVLSAGRSDGRTHPQPGQLDIPYLRRSPYKCGRDSPDSWAAF